MTSRGGLAGGAWAFSQKLFYSLNVFRSTCPLSELMRIPTRISAYSSAFQREIARRSTTKSVASERGQTTRALSVATNPPRPYAFHIGASWAGKVNRDEDQPFKVPFSVDSPIGSWRDKLLSGPKAVKSVDAGEDFFFVQEVRPICNRRISTSN